jgi:hypothetical protein
MGRQDWRHPIRGRASIDRAGIEAGEGLAKKEAGLETLSGTTATATDMVVAPLAQKALL